MKKIIKFILIISICFTYIFTNKVYAIDNESIPSLIIECINGIYLSDKTYDITNENDIDIKEKFKKDNKLDYENKNYLKIYDYIANNNIVFEKNKTSFNTRASSTYTLTKVFVHTYKFNSEKKVTFGVECYAVVWVNENNGQITSYAGPSVSLYQPAGGGAVREELTSTSTSVKKASNNYSITFTYKYAYKRIEASSYGQSQTYITPVYTKTLKYPS